ncbi:MAG TPA: hypothetical protein VIL45_07145 [Thermoplasmata archaeon]
MGNDRGKLISAMEQRGALMREVSPMLFTQYESLVKAGFRDEQAMYLVCQHHTAILLKLYQNPGEETKED